DAVAARELFHPRQVEFALGQPPCARVGQARGIDGHVVDRDQAAPHHRIERHIGLELAPEQRVQTFDLVRQNVDQEYVRRVGRQARAPVAQQVAADQRTYS